MPTFSIVIEWCFTKFSATTSYNGSLLALQIYVEMIEDHLCLKDDREEMERTTGLAEEN